MVKIDAVYYCPHHPQYGIGEYRIDCSCRKPSSGMLMRAKNDFDLDMKRSILIGDNETDMRAGISAGVGTLLRLGADVVGSDFISISSLNQAIKFLD